MLERLERQPAAWVLRDYHSPNLLWLPERDGARRVGVLDFQDAPARPRRLRPRLTAAGCARRCARGAGEARSSTHYCALPGPRDPGFDEAEFAFAYAALGAQRNTKILGIFVRLARRDGKPHYLAHFPRIWGYLERNLRHVTLAPLAAWYERHFPAVRAQRGILPP